MPLGGGKYGDEADELRRRLKAEGVVLVVLEGVQGSGFTAALSVNAIRQLPEILEEMARQIRKDRDDLCANSS